MASARGSVIATEAMGTRERYAFRKTQAPPVAVAGDSVGVRGGEPANPLRSGGTRMRVLLPYPTVSRQYPKQYLRQYRAPIFKCAFESPANGTESESILRRALATQAVRTFENRVGVEHRYEPEGRMTLAPYDGVVPLRLERQIIVASIRDRPALEPPLTRRPRDHEHGQQGAPLLVEKIAGLAVARLR